MDLCNFDYFEKIKTTLVSIEMYLKCLTERKPYGTLAYFFQICNNSNTSQKLESFSLKQSNYNGQAKLCVVMPGVNQKSWGFHFWDVYIHGKKWKWLIYCFLRYCWQKNPESRLAKGKKVERLGKRQVLQYKTFYLVLIPLIFYIILFQS